MKVTNMNSSMSGCNASCTHDETHECESREHQKCSRKCHAGLKDNDK